MNNQEAAMPEIGTTHTLWPPFGVVRVTHHVRNWIHIEPGDGRDSFDDPTVEGVATLTQQAAERLGTPKLGGKLVAVAALALSMDVATDVWFGGERLGGTVAFGDDGLANPRFVQKKRIPTRIKRKHWAEKVRT